LRFEQGRTGKPYYIVDVGADDQTLFLPKVSGLNLDDVSRLKRIRANINCQCGDDSLTAMVSSVIVVKSLGSACLWTVLVYVRDDVEIKLCQETVIWREVFILIRWCETSASREAKP